MAQVGTDQVGTAQVGTAQVGTAQVGTAQVGMAQVGTDQVGTCTTPVIKPFFMIFQYFSNIHLPLQTKRQPVR